jgi:L-malate glycosyltransferase
LKILYFSRDYTSHDHRFLNALVCLGHQPCYLRLEQRNHTYEERSLPPEVEIVHWKGGKRPARLADGPALLVDLKRVLGEVGPDLVMAGPVQRTAFLAALAGFQPLVSVSWGYDLLVDAGRSRSWDWATRFTLRRSAAMLGDCETVRRTAASYGMDPERTVIFPWGIDLQHFSPETSSKPDDGEVFTLLSNRSWEPVYGVDIIAKAYVQAVQRLKEGSGGAGHPQLRLLMLGGGSMAGELRRIFMQGGVLEQVHFAGQIGYADLPRYYRAANLYLSASHSDGSSLSLMEAMGCGTPVLVSDIPGNREWIQPGEQGWWFSVGSVPALVEGILRAVDQRRSLPEMGRRARALVEQRADWQRNYPKLDQLFDKALNHARRNGKK